MTMWLMVDSVADAANGEIAMTDEPKTAEYKQVRGLVRGLLLLRAMSAREGGRATSLELSKATGIHRTTVRRLLETLINEGYLRRSASDDSFRLLLKVRELSEGFTDVEWVSSVARPAMADLLQKVVWPSDLTTVSGDAMIVRESTHRFSPLSFHRSMVGRRLPILLTASGRAYFAHSSPDEQQSILQVILSAGEKQAGLAQDWRFIENLVSKVRADGYATNHGEWMTERETGAIAMPIIHRGRLLGCLNVIYLSRAVTTAQAVERYAKPLQGAVDRIVDALRDKGMEEATHA